MNAMKDVTNYLEKPEDEIEGFPEIYYFTDEDGNIDSREFVAEELIPDKSEVEVRQKENQVRRDITSKIYHGPVGASNGS
jgi:hypothetical protein